AGTSLLLFGGTQSSDRRVATTARLGVTAMGVIITTVGVLTLVEYVLQRSIGVDEWPWHGDHGRLSQTTATAFVLAGAALILLMFRRGRPIAVGQLLAVPLVAIGGIALIGYVLNYEVLYRVGAFSRVSANTALALLLLGGGLLAVRADRGWFREYAA